MHTFLQHKCWQLLISQYILLILRLIRFAHVYFQIITFYIRLALECGPKHLSQTSCLPPHLGPATMPMGYAGEMIKTFQYYEADKKKIFRIIEIKIYVFWI